MIHQRITPLSRTGHRTQESQLSVERAVVLHVLLQYFVWLDLLASGSEGQCLVCLDLEGMCPPAQDIGREGVGGGG